MTGKVLNYYASGHTAYGFQHLYHFVLEKLNRTFILKGEPGIGKSTLMKAIGENFLQKGIDIEYIHNPSHNGQIEGVIFTKAKVGIISENAMRSSKPKKALSHYEYVHLEHAINQEKLSMYREQMLILDKEISNRYKLAYDTFAKALEIHKKIENIYIKQMDFKEADQLTEELIHKIFGNEKCESAGTELNRFLGAATPQGAVDFIPNLTAHMKRRFLIKGRAGSGKSTMLRKIAVAGKNAGCDVELYHCGLDPKSLDMVIIRDKNIAVFDSTKPHEYFPELDIDEVIDIYERCFKEGTDEKFAKDIQPQSNLYTKTMTEAISYLKEAKELNDELKSYYTAATDFTIIDQARHTLFSKIEHLI